VRLRARNRGARRKLDQDQEPDAPVATRWIKANPLIIDLMRRTVHNPFMPSLSTVLAAAIALWIGILPALGAMAAFPQSADVAISDDGGMPCNQPMDGKAFATCALKCFQLCANEVVSPLVLPPRRGDVERSFVTDAFRSRPTVPPFRPPAA
jgi:hypothetical protein